MKLLLTACVLFLGTFALQAQSAKKADFSGSWEYEVVTPDGDYRGTLELSKVDGAYVGNLVSNGQKSPLKNLKMDGNKMSCSVNAEGYVCNISGEFVEETFKGGVEVEGNVFDIKGKRGGGK